MALQEAGKSATRP